MPDEIIDSTIEGRKPELEGLFRKAYTMKMLMANYVLRG